MGSALGLTRIDGKSGNYSFFRKAGPAPANLSNTFVISIVEDRSGYLWFGTYGGGLNRYDPRTGSFAAFRHNPADPHSLSHDIVYSLMVDHSRYPLGRNGGWPQPVRGSGNRPLPFLEGRPFRRIIAGSLRHHRGSERSALAGQPDASALRSGDRALHRLSVRFLRNGNGGPAKFRDARSQ